MIEIKTSNTILYCKQWSEMVAFYRSLFDFPVSTSLDWFIEFEMSETARLSIADESRTSIESNDGKGITLTFEVDDIQGTCTKLVKMGLEDVRVKEHSWGAQVIHVYDPEGNRVEFWVRLVNPADAAAQSN